MTQQKQNYESEISSILKVREELQLQLLGYFTNYPAKNGFLWLSSFLKDDDWDLPHRLTFQYLKEQSLQNDETIDVLLASQKSRASFARYSSYGNYVKSVFTLKELAKKLKQTTNLLRLYESFKKATKAVIENEDYDEVPNIISEVLHESLTNANEHDWQHIANIIDNLKSNPRNIFHVKSKFPTLNSLVMSYKSGDLHVFAARPGVGKTTILLNEAVSIAKTGEKVAFITLEMPAVQCMRRITAMASGVEYSELYNDEKLHAIASTHKIRELPLYFFEDYSISWADLLLKIRRICASGVRVVFIDQLSHVRHSEKAYSKADAIEKTVRALRSLALELNIVIILAVQINRAALGSEEPELEHLKDSGSIEEASQLVVMLHRKDGILKAHVKKATHGRLGSFELTFLASICKVEEVEHAQW